MTSKKRETMRNKLRSIKKNNKRIRNLYIKKAAVVIILVVAIGGFMFASSK
jgi:hypothetical protein